MKNLVRTIYPHYRKNAIHFFRRKIQSCYELRLGAELAAKFHTKLKKEDLEEIKQENIRRENEEDNYREREREAEMEERIRREVEERVQLVVEERMRNERVAQLMAVSSPGGTKPCGISMLRIPTNSMLLYS